MPDLHTVFAEQLDSSGIRYWPLAEPSVFDQAAERLAGRLHMALILQGRTPRPPAVRRLTRIYLSRFVTTSTVPMGVAPGKLN